MRGPLSGLSLRTKIQAVVWTVVLWVLLVLAVLLIGLLGVVLFVPLRLRAFSHSEDGSPGYLQVSWSRWVSGGIAGPQDDPLLYWRALFWSSSWRPLSEPMPASWQSEEEEQEPEQPDDQPKKRRSWRWRPSARRLMLLLDELSRAGRITRFRLDLDTGDWVLNARLFPLAAWAAARGWRVSIHFGGETLLELDARLRPARVLWALLRGLLRPLPDRISPATWGRQVGYLFYHPTLKSHHHEHGL